MKTRFLAFLLSAFSYASFSQSTGPFAIWEDQQNGGYYFVRMNAATGVKIIGSMITGITGFVLGGKSAIDPYKNYYYFVAQSGANARLMTIEIITGVHLFNPIMTDNVVGIEFNCSDSTLYGIKVVANSYSLCTVDPVTATTTDIAPINNISGYVGGSFSLDPVNDHYNFIANTFTNGYRLKTLNVQTGAVVYDNAFPDNVVGHRYNPVDGNVYGLWDNANAYKLEKINFATGTHTTVGTLTGVTPGYVTESHSMNEVGHYTFRGFNGPSFALFSVDVSNASVLHANNTPTGNNTVGFEEPACVSMNGISSIEEENSILVFPNPAKDMVNVKWSMDNGSSQIINMYNVFGECISTFTINHQPLTIDVSSLPDGIYLLQIQAEGASISKKFVIQH